MTSNICMLILIVFCTIATISQAQLRGNFYSTTCPNLVPTVRALVQNAVANEPRMAASLLRLHFHDCFVNGCDASVLLDNGGERQSPRNANSLRGFGVIDNIKFQVEAMCPGIVSCADILALAARESVTALGGPSWPVLHGRRDSRTAASAAFTNGQLPTPGFNVNQLIGLFAGKGLNTRDMVALSGGHTIGLSRCVNFKNRVWGGQAIAQAFALRMQQICPRPQGVGNNNLAPFDPNPNAFNNDYFESLTKLEGLLQSDQVLFQPGTPTRPIVIQYANDEQRFFTDFSAAMFKMSRISPKLGNAGVVRRSCRVSN